jgi:hypothetical protein
MSAAATFGPWSTTAPPHRFVKIWFTQKLNRLLHVENVPKHILPPLTPWIACSLAYLRLSYCKNWLRKIGPPFFARPIDPLCLRLSHTLFGVTILPVQAFKHHTKHFVTTMATQVARLIAKGRSYPDQRFSATKDPHYPGAADQLKLVLNKETKHDDRLRLLRRDPKRQYLAFLPSGRGAILSAPVLADDDDETILAVLGDDLLGNTVVSFPRVLFESSVVVLTDPQFANSHNLPVSSSKTDTLDGPPQDNGEKVPGSLQRLNFELPDDRGSPQLVALPLFFPWKQGVPIPEAGLTLASCLQPWPEFPELPHYIRGISHAIARNHKRSLHAGEKHPDHLFLAADVDKSGFGDLRLNPLVSVKLTAVNRDPPSGTKSSRSGTQSGTRRGANWRDWSNRTRPHRHRSTLISRPRGILPLLLVDNKTCPLQTRIHWMRRRTWRRPSERC